jgi:hypothetical protein
MIEDECDKEMIEYMSVEFITVTDDYDDDHTGIPFMSHRWQSCMVRRGGEAIVFKMKIFWKGYPM